MKNFILQLKNKINGAYLLIGLMLALYLLFEFTNFEYSLNSALHKIFIYIIVPILAIGSILNLKESTKNILKKDALSEGYFIYFLWWVWVVILLLFTAAMIAITFKAYFG